MQMLRLILDPRYVFHIVCERCIFIYRYRKCQFKNYLFYLNIYRITTGVHYYCELFALAIKKKIIIIIINVRVITNIFFSIWMVIKKNNWIKKIIRNRTKLANKTITIHTVWCIILLYGSVVDYCNIVCH